MSQVTGLLSDDSVGFSLGFRFGGISFFRMLADWDLSTGWNKGWLGRTCAPLKPCFVTDCSLVGCPYRGIGKDMVYNDYDNVCPVNRWSETLSWGQRLWTVALVSYSCGAPWSDRPTRTRRPADPAQVGPKVQLREDDLPEVLREAACQAGRPARWDGWDARAAGSHSFYWFLWCRLDEPDFFGLSQRLLRQIPAFSHLNY